ncbi:zinc finger protein gli2-like, partial [Lynx pardinus]
METSASVTATEKKDAKSGSLEGVAFPDPGRKASALAVATAAAAAVAAQGARKSRMQILSYVSHNFRLPGSTVSNGRPDVGTQ